MSRIKVNYSQVSREVQKIILDLPNAIDVISEQSFQSLEKDQFEEQEIVSVNLSKLIDHLIEIEFFNKLNNKVDLFNQKLETFFSRIDDVQSSLSSSFPKPETGSNIITIEKTEMDFIIKNSTDGVVEINKEFEDTFQDLTHSVNEYMQTALDKMNPYLITHSTNKLEQYIYSQEQKKVLSRIESVKRKVTGFFR